MRAKGDKKKSKVRAILICIEEFIKINIYVFKIHGRSISCVPLRAIRVLLEAERITSHKKNQTLSWWLKQRGANCVAPSMPSPYFSIVSQHLACVAARLMQETDWTTKNAATLTACPPLWGGVVCKTHFSGTSKGEKAHLCIMAPYLAKVDRGQNEKSDLSSNGTREPWLDFANACQEQHPAAQRHNPNSDSD